MDKKQQAGLIKEIRRHLLDMLNLRDPHPVQAGCLYRGTLFVFPHYDHSNYLKDITYFERKGWITFADNRLGGFPDFDQKYINLTADGKEIAEGTDTDKALEI